MYEKGFKNEWKQLYRKELLEKIMVLVDKYQCMTRKKSGGRAYRHSINHSTVEKNLYSS